MQLGKLLLFFLLSLCLVLSCCEKHQQESVIMKYNSSYKGYQGKYIDKGVVDKSDTTPAPPKVH